MFISCHKKPGSGKSCCRPLVYSWWSVARWSKSFDRHSSHPQEQTNRKYVYLTQSVDIIFPLLQVPCIWEGKKITITIDNHRCKWSMDPSLILNVVKTLLSGVLTNKLLSENVFWPPKSCDDVAVNKKPWKKVILQGKSDDGTM